jgi:hypothetical protein
MRKREKDQDLKIKELENALADYKKQNLRIQDLNSKLLEKMKEDGGSDKNLEKDNEEFKDTID